MGALVGPHDPYALCAPGLGWWVECECSWISSSYVTEGRAMSAHANHKVRAVA